MRKWLLVVVVLGPQRSAYHATGGHPALASPPDRQLTQDGFPDGDAHRERNGPCLAQRPDRNHRRDSGKGRWWSRERAHHGCAVVAYPYPADR